MYFISDETFDTLDPELQKQVIEDTKAHDAEGEMDEGMMSDSDKEMEGLENTEADGNQITKNHPKPEGPSKVKSFDDADAKSLAVMIGLGKPKKKMAKKEEDSNEDDAA